MHLCTPLSTDYGEPSHDGEDPDGASITLSIPAPEIANSPPQACLRQPQLLHTLTYAQNALVEFLIFTRIRLLACLSIFQKNQPKNRKGRNSKKSRRYQAAK